VSYLRALIALVLLSLSSHAWAEKRIALVIGNSAYQYAPQLTNPHNDAGDMASKLTELGFVVVTGRDLDLMGMRRSIRDFVDKLEGADLALFFYAGHGLQVNGNNYMIPIDAQLASNNDLDFEALPIDLVLSAMERNAKVNLIFLDACRDNPLAATLARSMGTRSVAVGRGLAKLDTGVGSLIVFSTQPGNVALDGAGRNSPFTTALLKNLGTPGQSITDDLIAVRRAVLQATDGKQVPWDSSSLTGPVVLNPSPVQHTTTNPPATSETDKTVELAYWNTIKDSTDKSFFDAYLQQYPNGVFAPLAKLKISVIEANQKQAETAALEKPDLERSANPKDNTAGTEATSPEQPNGLNVFDGTWQITRYARTDCGDWRELSSIVFVDNGVVSSDAGFSGKISSSGTISIINSFVFKGRKGGNVLTGTIKGAKGTGKFKGTGAGSGCSGVITMSKLN
jgi:uncharacterized caspase-like protein